MLESFYGRDNKDCFKAVMTDDILVYLTGILFFFETNGNLFPFIGHAARSSATCRITDRVELSSTRPFLVNWRCVNAGRPFA